MSRILLCYPNPSVSSPQKNPALSIFYPGAALEAVGHEVSYWDERWDTKDEMYRKILWADCVGVSSKTGYQLKGVLDILFLSKQVGKPTIFGGIHPSLLPQQCAQHPYVDYVIVGEGEKTIVELINHLEGKAGLPLGVFTSNGGKIRPQLKPEEIPSPITRKTISYFHKSLPNDVMLPSSRGCPSQCGFCYNSCYHHRKWRPIPLEQFETDLDRLRGIRMVQMADDYMGPRERILEVAKILHKRDIQWKLQLRADQVDMELIKEITRMGCMGPAIGIESGSDRVLTEIIHKGETVEDYIKASEIIAKYHIHPMYYFIVGFPGETKEELRQTFDLADKLRNIHNGDLSIAFFSFTPFPGTPLFDKAQEINIPIPNDIAGWSKYASNQSYSKELANIYHIAGLTFHRKKGDKTDLNFPGLKRLLISPFEILCLLRWKLRFWDYFDVERWCIEGLMRYVNKR